MVFTDADIDVVAATGDGPVVLGLQHAPQRTNDAAAPQGAFHGYGNAPGYGNLFYGAGLFEQILYMTLLGAGVEITGALLKSVIGGKK